MTARCNAARVSTVVRQVFGLAELRPEQQAVIDEVLAKRHTLAIMPTGAVKSLCYQVPAMLMPGMTVVVSPLIALMRDQFDKLSALGLEAVQVNSAIPTGDIQRAHAKIGRRAVEFVFTTPEQLATTDLRQLLTGDAVDLVVIDEAHCISQWGHDFRPAYLDVLSGLRAFGSPTILALTAPATPQVTADIEQQLNVGPLRARHSEWDNRIQHRLRGHGAPRRRTGCAVASRGHLGDGVPWPSARARPSRRPGRVHDRRSADHHRHQCVWHGYRQARHPHDRPL